MNPENYSLVNLALISGKNLECFIRWLGNEHLKKKTFEYQEPEEIH